MHLDSATLGTHTAATNRWALVTFVLTAIVFQSGCTTFSALGLPFGANNNRLLRSAKEIGERPGLPLQVPAELSKRALGAYVVEIGDTISVEATKFDATIRLPGDQIVKPDGTISLGEFGRQFVAGKTVDQIEYETRNYIGSAIRQQILAEFSYEESRRQQTINLSDNNLADSTSELQDQDDAAEEAKLRQQRVTALERQIREQVAKNLVTVRLVDWESKKIYVLGEVNSPGSFGYTGNQTVLDAIVEAGGLSTRANHHEIVISRPTECGSCRIVAKVCYDYIVQLGDTSTNYQLLPGDRVFVPALTFADDFKQSLSFGRDKACPKCAGPPRGCDLPTGCPVPQSFESTTIVESQHRPWTASF